MAVRKINYKDKSPLQTKPEIPEENKVNAEDLNQIKEVVNNNADEIELRQLKEEGKGLSKNDFTDELKAKLESLNNYNDTEIKKEINEINKKVAENTGNDIKQDTEIETLKNNYTNLQKQNTKLESQIKKDRENMINLEVEGQSIHVEDSSDLEGQLEVLGNAEQDVREGYNILENILTDRTVNGITVKINKDKSITLNGTATENTSLDITKNFTITEESVFSGMCDGYGYNKMLIQIQGSDYNVNIPNSTPQVLQPKDNVKVRIYIYAGTNMTNALIKPQINKGNVTKLYEAYGASPSPEYPSEIRAVGDNINLLENTAKTQTVNGVTFTVNEDGTVIANGTATSLAQISLVANVKLPTGTYTIKDGKAYVESAEFNDWFDGLNNPFTLTFNTEVLLKNVYIQVKQGETVNNKIFYPKLEKGTVATSYSKFGQGSVEIKKTTANYYNVKSYTGSQPPPVDENDWITITGNNTGTSPKYLNYFTRNLDVIVGEKYWIVAEVKNVLGKGTFNITSQDNNQGQFKGYVKQIQDIKAGDVFIYQSTAVKTEGDEHGLRTFIGLRPGESANITFRLSVLKDEPNVQLWKYIPYDKETFLLPVQKPMLEGDYFIKEVDGWKEVHKWGKVISDGIKNKFTLKHDTIQTSTNGFYKFELPGKIKGVNGDVNNGVCNYLKYIGEPNASKAVNKIGLWWEGSGISNYASLPFLTLDEANKWLQEKNTEGNPVYICYKLETPTKLPCTPEQTKVLDELDNFTTYKLVTNITTDSIAKLKLKYIADTKTYVDNKTSNLEQQVSVINQLLSTTKTSSILLDNLQKDIESEVL